MAQNDPDLERLVSTLDQLVAERPSPPAKTTPADDRAPRTIATLEAWLAVIALNHVTRTQPRA